ncbi:MBL fold metallo-hydrolase [Exiguobacterium sp. s63]|uniref:MBL fold metallo-hydrolase n=1 Tax=Exiguobacterium sp. s63 TaxID=2751274 RepID=UPI001BEA2EF8|nr:MBL fold metallo-hydrolase [Exiguobacterium sp. s63]
MKQFESESVKIYQSALWKTTSTIVEGEDFILLVDPTWLPIEIEEIKKDIEKIRAGRTLYLLFTHGDFDHIIGYGAFPDAIVIGSEGMKHHPRKQYKLNLINQFDNEYYIDRPYDIQFPELDCVIKEDGQQLKLGETTITFYLAPGHTHDGLFAIIEPQGIWIAGDYLSDFELPYIFDQSSAYLNTLDKAEVILKNRNITLLIPSHGEFTTDTGAMLARLEMARSYIKRLVRSVEQNDNEAIIALGEEMKYPSSFTRECHEGNVDLVRQECLERGVQL